MTRTWNDRAIAGTIVPVYDRNGIETAAAVYDDLDSLSPRAALSAASWCMRAVANEIKVLATPYILNAGDTDPESGWGVRLTCSDMPGDIIEITPGQLCRLFIDKATGPANDLAERTLREILRGRGWAVSPSGPIVAA